jgi:SWI/SNF-related matrix-associated actin-dependent regulator of chromatin subfamily A member 5
MTIYSYFVHDRKVVNVYRLCTEDSIEVKIIERAQQKLKLDAMVVQQGRLQDKKKNVSKDEMMDIIKFGADKVFRSKDSSITDDDIDMILSQGEKRTAELNDKLQKHTKGDLLDFRLEGDAKAQEFEGVDYSNRDLRQLMLNEKLAADSVRRERRPVQTYNENSFYKSALDESRKLSKSGGTKGFPKEMRRQIQEEMALPKMDEWQFFNRARLMELQEVMNRRVTEFQKEWDEHAKSLAAVKDSSGEGGVDDSKDVPTLDLPPLLKEDLMAERKQLLKDGFPRMTRSGLRTFALASAEFGRTDYDNIAKQLGQLLGWEGTPEDRQEVERFATVFWEKGPTQISTFEKMMRDVEKGESKLEERGKLNDATNIKIQRYENPWEQMTFNYVGLQGKTYTEEEDRYLLCFAHRHGYGNWEAVRKDMYRCDRFRFDYFLHSKNAEELGRRCKTLMSLAEKENASLEKKEKEDGDKREKELQERRKVEEQAIDQRKAKIADLQKQLSKSKEALEKMRKESASNDGDGTKFELFDDGEGGAGSAAKKVIGNDLAVKYVAELARLIKKNGDLSTEKMMGTEKMAATFASMHPGVSKRQTQRKIDELALKEREGRKVVWILKDEFKHLLDAEKHPDVYEEGVVRQAFQIEKPAHEGSEPSKKKKRKKDRNAPKKAQSAYIFFCQDEKAKFSNTLKVHLPPHPVPAISIPDSSAMKMPPL